ncbi:MAG: hypothetical protein U0360_04460 [Dehalococcoidia bacterium]
MICSPPLGLNWGIHRDLLDPSAPPEPARVPPAWLRLLFDHARFDLRRPLPDAATGLRALSRLARIVILTGRRTSPAAWLRRHNLDRHIEAITINDTALRSPHFKARALERLRPLAHLDDDPRTVQLLAELPELATLEVYLRDWSRNRNLRLAPRVTRVATLHDLAARLAAHASSAGQPIEGLTSA